MSDYKISALFVDLDTILDTRLSVIYDLGEDKVKEVFKLGYTHRIIDRWSCIDHDLYTLNYTARGKLVLKNAVLTPMVTFIKEFVTGTISQTENTPFNLHPKVIINLYPYILNDSDKDILLETISFITKGLCDVELVFMSLEDITPKYVKRNLSILIKYDYVEWLDTHSKNNNFNDTTCPEIGMLGPAIFRTVDEMNKSKQTTKELGYWEAIEITASPLIGLKLLPSEHFSIALGAPSKDIVA